MPEVRHHPRYSWQGFVLAGFGSGYAPVAPGTWGTLAAMPAFWLLWMLGHGSVPLLALGVLFVLVAGCGLCQVLLPQLDDQDPGWIVIDEWAGVGLCLLLLAPWLAAEGWWLWLASFVLFRLFDILKPWPVCYVEHLGPEWWSIMADDLLAGVLAALPLLLLLRLLA